MEGPNGKTLVAVTTWGSSSGHNMRLDPLSVMLYARERAERDKRGHEAWANGR